MSTIIGFNYGAVANAALRKRLQQQAQQIRELVRRTGETIVEVGRRLAAVRDELDDAATFRAWLAAEFEFSQSIAVMYMQSAARFGGCERLQNFQPHALFALSRSYVPEDVVNEAVEMAGRGELVTAAKAKALLAEHGVGPRRADAGVPRQPLPEGKLIPTLERALETLAGGLESIAANMSREDREALADRFLELAMKLRNVGAPEKPVGKVRSRARAGAA